MSESKLQMYEILVPTIRNDGRFFRLRFHRVWDKRVRDLTGGLTVLAPAKGQWINDENKVFTERMIPVRIACTEDMIRKIAEMTMEYYDQEAVLYYKVSDHVEIIKREK